VGGPASNINNFHGEACLEELLEVYVWNFIQYWMLLLD
jgi:hypothetical protein